MPGSRRPGSFLRSSSPAITVRTPAFPFEHWPWWRYLITQAGVILHYVRLIFVPWPLVLDYDWSPASVSAAILPVIVVTTVAAITGWALLRRHPLAFPAAVSFSCSPDVERPADRDRGRRRVSDVSAARVRDRPGRIRGVRGAEQGGGTAIRASRHRARRRRGAVWITLVRNRDYQSGERIGDHTLQKRPANTRARANYATILLAEGRIERPSSTCAKRLRLIHAAQKRNSASALHWRPSGGSTRACRICARRSSWRQTTRK